MANRKQAVKEGDTRRREYERNYRRQKSEEANDIGELPSVENPKRKKACEHDLVKFCSTYLPEYFFRPWSKAQLEIAKNVEKVIENGGSQAIAHKRRGAKTTICLGGLMWAMLYGKHMYSYFVAASNGATLDAKAFFDLELMENDLLCADFPEVCVPIRKTEGIKQRNPSYHGQKCNIEMTGDTVRLPTMRIYKNGKLQKTKRGKPAVPLSNLFQSAQRLPVVEELPLPTVRHLVLRWHWLTIRRTTVPLNPNCKSKDSTTSSAKPSLR